MLNRTYSGSFTVKVENDEGVEAMAKLTDTPLVRVTAPELGWDEKPFVVRGDDGG